MEILIFLLFIVWLVFWVKMLVEIGRRPDSVYREAGESKAIWFLAVLVFQFFGTLVYFLMVREKLDTVEHQALSTGSTV